MLHIIVQRKCPLLVAYPLLLSHICNLNDLFPLLKVVSIKNCQQYIYQWALWFTMIFFVDGDMRLKHNIAYMSVTRNQRVKTEKATRASC